VLLGEYLAMKKVPTRSTIIATAIMVLGAVIAAYKDLTYDPVSYILVALTNLSTAGYTVAIAKVKKTTNLSVFGLLYYNTVITLPFLIGLTLVSSEIEKVRQFEQLWDPTFMFLFLASALLAFFLNITTFFATALNSPLAVTVTGQLKNFVAFLLGLVMFSDYIYEPVNMLGLVIGFIGGVLYAQWSYYESQPNKAAVPTVIDNGTLNGSKALAVNGGPRERDSTV
jgi:solute carrier family 35 protein